MLFGLTLVLLLAQLPGAAQQPMIPETSAPPDLQQAQKGNAAAEFRVGQWYNSGISGRVDSQQAALWFKRASDHGSADATALLGSLYLYGHGVATDQAQAFQLIQSAVNHGSVLGKVFLAQMYMRGWHVNQDHAKAHELLALVGDKEPFALTLRGIMELQGPEKHPDKAVELLARAAAEADSGAMLSLGEMYLFGAGVAQDFNQAAFWFRKAVKLDNRAAEFRLGQMYAKGTAVPRNLTQAYALFKRAAEQGYIPAQTLCGAYNYYGYGIARDPVQAYYWFAKAAVYSNPAQTWLERVSGELTAQQRKTAAAMVNSAAAPTN